MNFLDMKTVVFIFLIINILISGILLPLWIQNRKRFAGISFWFADYILQGIAQLLLILRGKIPDFFSMAVSNTMVIAGIILFYIGLRRFIGYRGREAPYYLYIPLFIAVHSYFIYFAPSLPSRTINTSAGIILFSLLCSLAMFTIPDRHLRRLGRGTGAVFILYAIFALGRLLIAALLPAGDDFYQANVFDVLSIFTFMLLGISLTFSLILMINGRLLLEIGRHAAEKEHTAYNLGERVKELNCLYAVSSLDEQTGISTSEILKAAAGYIPPALQHPEHAGARITYGTEEFNIGDISGALSGIGSDIIERGAAVGRVEAFYMKAVSPDNEDPFLHEERAMIRAIAGHLGSIMERKKAEEEVRRLLDEKGLLLTEVHHRIKNNMASVVSLLSLQADDADNEATAGALTVARNRVYAMMELYDRLYRQSEFDCLNARDYFSSLISELHAAYDADDSVAITIDIDDISLTTKRIFPLGIIINELVTNAFKYAFTGTGEHTLTVSLHGKDDGNLEIIIADNGHGSADQGAKPGGFGLKLVDTLIKETRGNYVISRKAGTVITITMPGETC